MWFSGSGLERPNATKGGDGVAVSFHLWTYDLEQEANNIEKDIDTTKKQLNKLNALFTASAVIQLKHPTLNVPKMTGKEIDTILHMCVPQEKSIDIMTKNVADTKAKLLEEHVSDIKISACVKEIEKNVSKLNQQVESLVNSTSDRSELSSIDKNRKKRFLKAAKRTNQMHQPLMMKKMILFMTLDKISKYTICHS